MESEVGAALGAGVGAAPLLSLSKIGLTWDLRKISWSAIDRARASTKAEKKAGINRLEIDLAKRAQAQRESSSS